MRILLLHQYFLEADDPGGSRWNETTRIWKEAGHSTTVIAGMLPANGFRKRSEYKGRIVAARDQDGTEVYRVHIPEVYNHHFFGRMAGYLCYMILAAWVVMCRVRNHFDLVIVTSPPLFAGIAGWMVAAWKGLPLVTEVRDLWPESAVDTGVLKNVYAIRLMYFLEKTLYAKSRLITVLTPPSLEILAQKKGIPLSKLVLVPNAADFHLAEQALQGFDRKAFRAKLKIEAHFVVIYVGAHGIANGLEQLIDIASALVRTNVLFLLVGDGMQKKELVSRVNAAGLTNFRFMAPVSKSEALRLVSASDMGISILAKNETFKTVFANKTFDYMTCSLPVLMAIDGASRKLVADAKCGEFIDPGNPAHCAEVIESYRNDRERLQREGRNGYTYAKENFDREEWAKFYMMELERTASVSKKQVSS